MRQVQPHGFAVVALLLAAGLRLFRLDAQSMWFDEAARLLIARTSVAEIMSNAGGDTMPPFYHLTLHFWSQLGLGDFWLRLPSALASLMLVAVIYRLAIDLFDQRTAVITAFLTAILPYQVFHAQQANLYGYLVLLSGLQMLFFWRAIRGDGRWPWLGYVISAALGLYTHYLAALTPLTLHVWFLLQRDRNYHRWQRLFMADTAVAMLFVPQLARLIEKAGVVAGNFWLTRPGPLAPLTTLHLFTVSYSLPEIWLPVALFLTVLLLALSLLELSYLYRERPGERPSLQFVALLSFMPVAFSWLLSQRVPIYLDRTLIVVTPAYTILLARALAGTRIRSPLPFAAGLMTVAIVLSLGHYYFNPAFAKPDYRGAAAYIGAHSQPGDVIVHTGNGSYIPFLMYRDPVDHYLLDGDPAPHHPPQIHRVAGGRAIAEAELNDYEHVWLVVALDHSIAYQQQVMADFDDAYPISYSADVDGILLRRYALNTGNPY